MNETAELVRTKTGPSTVVGDYILRPFEKDDVNAFIELGQWLIDNSKYNKTVTMDVEKVVRLFMEILTNPYYFGVFVETNDAEPVGAVIGVAQEFYMSRDMYASDMGVGLLPEYRKDSELLLPQMIAQFEAWAIGLGVKEIWISTSTGAHGTKYQKFVEALGYEVIGFNSKRRVG